MGYMRHHAIVVTGTNEESAKAAHAEAIRIFHADKAIDFMSPGTAMVSPILESPVNGYFSFFIAPDGSKEGWDTSDSGNEGREMFIKELRLMRRRKVYLDWVEVQFGDDNNHTAIIHSHSE